VHVPSTRFWGSGAVAGENTRYIGRNECSLVCPQGFGHNGEIHAIEFPPWPAKLAGFFLHAICTTILPVGSFYILSEKVGHEP